MKRRNLSHSDRRGAAWWAINHQSVIESASTAGGGCSSLLTDFQRGNMSVCTHVCMCVCVS